MCIFCIPLFVTAFFLFDNRRLLYFFLIFALVTLLSQVLLYKSVTMFHASSYLSFILVALSLITFLSYPFPPCSIMSINESSFASSHFIRGSRLLCFAITLQQNKFPIKVNSNKEKKTIDKCNK